MKYKTFLVIVFIAINVFSQHTYFLDEEISDIDSITYKRKCKNKMLKCFQINKSDTIYNVIYDKYKFGQLSESDNKRIRNEILRNRNFDGTIIIHYAYGLRNIDELQKYRIDQYYKSQKEQVPDSVKYSYENIQLLNKKMYYHIDKKSLIKRGHQKSKRVNKCIRKFEKKYNVNILHYYFGGNPEYTSNIAWIKDNNQIIKNYFFKYFASYHFVIIKPNGTYLQIGGVMPSSNFKRLIEYEDWSSFIEDLNKSNLKGKPIGFFNTKSTNTDVCN